MTTKSNQPPRDVVRIPLPVFDYAREGEEAKYRIKLLCWKEGSPEPFPKTFESITANGFLGELLSGTVFSDPPFITRRIIVGVEKID